MITSRKMAACRLKLSSSIMLVKGVSEWRREGRSENSRLLDSIKQGYRLSILQFSCLQNQENQLRYFCINSTHKGIKSHVLSNRSQSTRLHPHGNRIIVIHWIQWIDNYDRMVLKNQTHCRRSKNLVWIVCIWCVPIASIDSYYLSCSWRSRFYCYIWNCRDLWRTRVSSYQSTIIVIVIGIVHYHHYFLSTHKWFLASRILCRFFTQMGACGSSLYNASLSVYFVLVIKFDMKEKAFKRKAEFWCHFIPNAYAICSSIFLQVGGYFNSMGGESSRVRFSDLFQLFHHSKCTKSRIATHKLVHYFLDIMCWISAAPVECLSDSDIECSRGGKEALFYRKWLGMSIFPFSFVIIFINMILIIHFVLTKKQKSNR